MSSYDPESPPIGGSQAIEYWNIARDEAGDPRATASIVEQSTERVIPIEGVIDLRETIGTDLDGMDDLKFIIDRIAEYNADDAADLGVLRQHMSPHKPNIPVSEETIREFTEHPDQRSLIIARVPQTGQIVSSATINKIVSPDVGNDKMGWLGFVSTHQDFRRNGIYGMVWLEGLGWCDEREIPTMEWHSNQTKENRADAIRFYLGRGAVKLESTLFSIKVKEGIAVATAENQK